MAAKPAVKGAIAVVIAERIGGDASEYAGFLDRFYYDSRGSHAWDKPLSEIAAVAAVVLEQGK